MIRKAEARDVGAVCDLLGQVKAYFRDNGITMWQNGYPSDAVIEDDILTGRGYVFECDGEVAGFMFLDHAAEPFQDTVKGEWEDSDPVTMHRLMVDSRHRRKGIASKLMIYAEEFARDAGAGSIRTETDATNLPMRSFMASTGYREVGVLRFDNSDKIGFEKLLR